jgi:hypothetical protein
MTLWIFHHCCVSDDVFAAQAFAGLWHLPLWRLALLLLLLLRHFACPPYCLLQEDSSVTEKRAAVRTLYDKIKMAIDDVQYKQEKVKRKDHEGDNVSVWASSAFAAVQPVCMCEDLCAHQWS